MYCQKCGQELLPDSSFCVGCERKKNADAVATASASFDRAGPGVSA